MAPAQVNQHGTLDPATHAYTFWEGVPVKARAAFGGLFAKSSTLRCVAIVQRAVRKMAPEALMEGYGFGALTLVATVKGVHMSGAQTHSLCALCQSQNFRCTLSRRMFAREDRRDEAHTAVQAASDPLQATCFSGRPRPESHSLGRVRCFSRPCWPRLA